jgi:LuxR family maltose regulon positive regulatory protein
LIQIGELATLHGWLKSLPEELVQAGPILSTYAGWLSLLAGNMHAAVSYAEDARAAANETLPAVDRGRLLSLLAQLAVAHEENDEAIRLAGEALALIGVRDETFRTLTVASLARAYQQLGDIAGAVGALRSALQRNPASDCQPITDSISANLVVLLNQQGRLREAESLCRRSLDGLLQSCSGPPPAAGMLYVGLAQVLYEQNDLDAAHQAVSQGLELNRQLGMVRLNLSAWQLLALLELAQGHSDAALKLLESARHTAVAAGLSRFAALFAAQAAEVHLFNGDLHAVEAWLVSAGLSAGGPLNQVLDIQSLTIARLLLAQKRPVEAHELLTRLDKIMHKGERSRARMTARILQAKVQDALGLVERAAQEMAFALEMAAPEGYLRVFLHEGVHILPILTRSRPAAPDFVDTLLAAFQAEPRHSPKHSPSSMPGQLPLVESLNERELQVLRLIAQGFSNREIAGQLVLALSTVKSHINNVYGKLGAKSRTQAVALARALGLLDG